MIPESANSARKLAVLFCDPSWRYHRRMTKKLLLLLVACPSFLWVTQAAGQDCGCDHEVSPSTESINGADLGVAPGEVVCILGGQRPFLRIYEMIGTEEAPIIVKNCGGQVDIDNSDRGYGLTLDGSSHVRITGSGDDAFDYGFRIRASRDGPDYSASCIIAGGMSTNYELDHMEAYECGFAGVSAKTDPNCEERDLRDFVQRDSVLHHLYLHDTGGEGIYFGSTGFPSRTGNCDGAEVELFPHSHEGVYIHDNIIEDTGWDGAQIGVSPRDCYFYRNRIARVGLRGVEYQMQGLQIGGGSRCEVSDNFVAHGPAVGLIVLDAGDTRVENNVFFDFLDGIYVNDRDSDAATGARYTLVHNTVVSIQDRGITLFGTMSQDNLVANNFVVAATGSPLGFSVDGTETGNLIAQDLESAGFEDASAEDFMLREGSPAIDAGDSTIDTGTTMDQRGAPRDETPDAGAFEYGTESPDTPDSPPGPGQGGNGTEDPAPSTSGEESTDETGCSCRASGTTRRLYVFHVGILAALGTLSWRRRRRPV